MAYLKKVAVPDNVGTVEVKIGRLELSILESAKTERQVWKIAEGTHYLKTIYKTVFNLRKKGLIKVSREGKRKGLTISLTTLGEKVLNELQKEDKNK